MCAAQDAKSMFRHAAGRFWKLPQDTPDERMMTHPVWSTWAQSKAEINESVVMQFAQDIVDNGFDNSQLEIDDNWETCYGDATFDLEKFPDPAKMVQNVKNMGFRVTLWIHPFINQECESFSFAAFPPNMYLVRDPKSKEITNDGTFGGGGIFGDFVHFHVNSAYAHKRELLLLRIQIDNKKNTTSNLSKTKLAGGNILLSSQHKNEQAGALSSCAHGPWEAGNFFFFISIFVKYSLPHFNYAAYCVYCFLRYVIFIDILYVFFDLYFLFDDFTLCA